MNETRLHGVVAKRKKRNENHKRSGERLSPLPWKQLQRFEFTLWNDVYTTHVACRRRKNMHAKLPTWIQRILTFRSLAPIPPLKIRLGKSQLDRSLVWSSIRTELNRGFPRIFQKSRTLILRHGDADYRKNLRKIKRGMQLQKSVGIWTNYSDHDHFPLEIGTVKFWKCMMCRKQQLWHKLVARQQFRLPNQYHL